MSQEKTLEYLIAKDTIRDLEYNYSRAVDRRDAELFQSLFHPGATVDYAFFVGSAEEFVDVTVKRFAEMWEFPMHLIGNTIIEVEGDRAYVESYCLDTLYPRDGGGIGQGQKILHQWTVRYVSRYERRNGDWRIVHRLAIPEVRDVRISGGNPASVDPSYPNQTRYDLSDPAYAR